MNFLDIYENACTACGVRPNSLLHKTLREAPVRPITHLRLADNYVGPKGFLALIPLIEKCQTLESLDLRGNGLDNGSVIALARALRSHLGIHTVDLSRNPISAEGGRHLLELLETNQRLVHLVVEQTDLFDAFVERLYQAAAANQGDTDNRPIIVPTSTTNNNNNNQRPSSPSAAAASSRTSTTATSPSNQYHQHQYNSFSPTAAAASTDRRRSSYGGRKASSVNSMGGIVPSSSSGNNNNAMTSSSSNLLLSSNTNNNNNMMRSSQPNITGALKPKPPTPAIASEAYSRLTKEQRDLMKERYKQKAAVFTQVEQTASHKLAADFRAEIALLEGAQAKADYSRQGLHQSHHNHSPSSSSPQNLRNQNQEEEEDENNKRQQQQDDVNNNEQPSATTTIEENNVVEKNSPESKFFSSGNEETLPDHHHSSEKILEQSLPQRQNNNNNNDQVVSTSSPSNNNKAKNPVLVSVPMVPISSPELTSNAALTPADQFRALFNQGCAYYGEKNFDAAYCSWNEAVHIATQERNREWLTIVQSNLQNLSFEMLTSEAQDAIDRGDLDDASKSLELALKLATKARNAGWEAEVIKLRRNVLHGSFQANHDKATSLLEQLIRLEPIDVTDDHRFVSPTGKLEAHTAAFVNEWTTLLIVKELMEHCVQSYRCAKGIGGNNGAALENLVHGTVTTVSKHLIRIYWSALLHDPMSLPWLGAGRFTRDERESLIKLWADLRGTVKELGHTLWSVVELSQYGNLLLASHELSDALDCFEKAAENAGEISDRFLTGTSLLFCGIVNLQRSSYAKAEALFRAALSDLGEVRFNVAPLRPPPKASAATAGTSDSAANNLLGKNAPNNHNNTSTNNNEPQFVTRDAGKNHGLIVNPAASVSNNNNNSSNEKIQQLIPIEDLCFFHSQAFFMLSRTLIGSYRYRDALEVHERYLLYQHHDVLFEKLQSNFSSMPTTDHLRATSASLGHPLVYYAAHYRYDWNLDRQNYDVSEHIYSWIVVSEGDGKFNSVDISAEFGISSLFQTVKEARRTLFVDTNNDTNNSGGDLTSASNNNNNKIVTSLDGVAWKAPLRRLYTALMHQVIDVLSSYAAYSDLGLFTVIPHGFLWLVPFPALLDERDQFLLERITLSHALCATQLLMSELAVRHLLVSNNPKNIVVRPPPQLVDPSKADPELLNKTKKKNKNKKNESDENNNNEDNDDSDSEAEEDDQENNEVERDEEKDEDDDFYNYDDEKKNNKKSSNNKKNKQQDGAVNVLRNGITEEQMNDEATEMIRALGNGTLELSGSGTSADVLSQIAFTNISVICSSFVQGNTGTNNNNNSNNNNQNQLQTTTASSSTSDPNNNNNKNQQMQLLFQQQQRSSAMRGGIHVASTFDTVGVLSCEEIAFSSLPIETVVLPYTAIDVETITRDSNAEAALSTSRGFLGAGTVSVVFSMWQCSDVYPADFLTIFGKDLTKQQQMQIQQQQQMQQENSASSPNSYSSGIVSSSNSNNSSTGGNRAIALARAVRAMIREESKNAMGIGSSNDETRPLSCFKPRRWAGIILLGLGEISASMMNNNQNNRGGNNNNVSNFNEYNAFA